MDSIGPGNVAESGDGNAVVPQEAIALDNVATPVPSYGNPQDRQPHRAGFHFKFCRKIIRDLFFQFGIALYDVIRVRTVVKPGKLSCVGFKGMQSVTHVPSGCFPGAEYQRKLRIWGEIVIIQRCPVCMVPPPVRGVFKRAGKSRNQLVFKKRHLDGLLQESYPLAVFHAGKSQRRRIIVPVAPEHVSTA